jgi:hypothetical protein
VSIYDDELLDQLSELPREAAYRERANLLSLGKKISKQSSEVVEILVEVLTSAGAWNEASELATAAHQSIEDTIRNKPIRLEAALLVTACSYEAAIAAGEASQLEELGKQWNSTLAEIETDREENKVRRDPLHGLLGSR